MVKSPCHFAVALPVTLHPGALEHHFGELIRLEEIGRAQVAVALGVASVDAGGLDVRLDEGHLRMLLVDFEADGEILELAADLRQHHVPCDELN